MNRTRNKDLIGRTDDGEKWHIIDNGCHLVEHKAFIHQGEIDYIIETNTSPLNNQINRIEIRDSTPDGLDESDICRNCIHNKQKVIFG